MAAATSAERGGVQRDTYERVKAVLAASPGLTTRDAFARVAEETGRSVGTIQTSYYRIAREDPNTTVKARPRSGAKAARRPRAATTSANGRTRGRQSSSGGDLDRLIERFLDAQTALLDHVKQIDRERKDLDRIKALLQG
jgi:hypothetical protein